ncbi:hypothetical protein P1X14_03420 [Sphingomonas sp. AOB5]|uniref:hypothetical protein n=1 Tax=Sphingomonas sp. AOB5 TaxID=3034017 RepID=UPI0023F6D357|nr:hypothetical protein [Sphingomonas sp. AOB5]MDF7774287.1 hypothetical protein [Sphingomonas sp. AOB5]
MIYNKTIKLKWQGSEYYSIVIGDKLAISKDEKIGQFYHLFDIPYVIKIEDRLDLIVLHAEILGDHYIYWSESFRNIPSSQGILKYSGSELVPVCQGIRMPE